MVIPTQFSIRSILILTALAGAVCWFVFRIVLPDWSLYSFAQGCGIEPSGLPYDSHRSSISFTLGLALQGLYYVLWVAIIVLPGLLLMKLKDGLR